MEDPKSYPEASRTTHLETSEPSDTHPIASFQGSLIRNNIGYVPRCAAIPHNKTSPSQWTRYFTDGWSDSHTWKSAFIELIAAGSLCFLSGLIDTTIGNFNTAHAPAYVGVTNIVLLSEFIVATAPGSGGHINPLITFSTLLTGLTGFSRGILYMVGQTAGAALAGGVLLGTFGYERAAIWKGGGCFRDPGTVTAGQALMLEVFSSFVLLFLSYGVALDPRQGKLFGPFAGPLAVGVALGLVSFAGAGLVPGFTGASMNPARCFAFAITRREFSSQWIWWIGPAVGGVLHAAAYHVVPPYHERASRDH